MLGRLFSFTIYYGFYYVLGCGEHISRIPKSKSFCLSLKEPAKSAWWRSLQQELELSKRDFFLLLFSWNDLFYVWIMTWIIIMTQNKCNQQNLLSLLSLHWYKCTGGQWLYVYRWQLHRKGWAHLKDQCVGFKVIFGCAVEITNV